jgi:hypothetical protein
MKKVVIFSFFILMLVFFSNAYTDNASFRLVEIRNDAVVGGELHMNLQMQITSGSPPRTLNSLTIEVLYGTQLTAFDFPATNWATRIDEDYSRSVTKPYTGLYRVLVTGNNIGMDGLGVPPGWDVTASWQTVVTLRWTINTATSVTIQIDDGTDDAAHFDNLNNNPQAEVSNFIVTNEDPGDVSLPVELASFNALIDNNMVKLRWVTESEINNAGFELYRSPDDQDSYNLLNSYLYNPNLIGQGNSNIRHEYKYEDNTVEPGKTYWYKLADVDLNGDKTFHSPISVTLSEQVLPAQYRLYPAFPNPFNPSTRLRFDIPDNEGSSVKASLVIYNTLGQIVKTLYQGYSETGSYEFLWLGDNEKGHLVPNGIYIVVLITEKYQQSRKLILMK